MVNIISVAVISIINNFVNKFNLSETDKEELLTDIKIKNEDNRLKYWDIVRVREKYKDLVFTELDKDVCSWSIRCPMDYYCGMKENFNVNSGHYENVKDDMQVVKEKIVKSYKKLGLQNVCKGNREWDLNYPRVISKAKDVNRNRAIVSYRKWYGYRLGRVVARALNVLI